MDLNSIIKKSNGNKVAAMKLIREEYDVGVTEVKNLIDLAFYLIENDSEADINLLLDKEIEQLMNCVTSKKVLEDSSLTKNSELQNEKEQLLKLEKDFNLSRIIDEARGNKTEAIKIIRKEYSASISKINNLISTALQAKSKDPNVNIDEVLEKEIKDFLDSVYIEDKVVFDLDMQKNQNLLANENKINVNYKENMGKDYLKIIEEAENMADEMSKTWNPELTNQEDMDKHDAVFNCFLKAFDMTKIGTEEQKEVVFRMSDYLLWRGLSLVKVIKFKLKEENNRPITEKELKEFTDNIVMVLDSFMDDNVNRTAYINRKEELINSFYEEITNQGIKVKKEGCYIATVVYESYDSPQVCILRQYRDNSLSKSIFGRMFIHIYYYISPKLVKLFGETKWFKCFWKYILNKIVDSLYHKGYYVTPNTNNNRKK